MEWWVHTKAAGRSLGHQLHFDTCEASLDRTVTPSDGEAAKEPQVLHPKYSSVLYLSALDTCDPTIILNQTTDRDSFATEAMVSLPQENSFLLFPGNLLHGVLPTLPKDASTQQGDGGKHRLTLMVGFWTLPPTKDMTDQSVIGPKGRIPRVTRNCTWPQILEISGKDYGEATPKKKPVHIVRSPWEEVQRSSAGVQGSCAVKERGEESCCLLELPEEVDQRFFVTRMEQFREQLSKS